MPRRFSWQTIRHAIREELHELTVFHQPSRPWEMPFAAALSYGLPLLFGAWFGHLDQALLVAFGGMVFLYLPRTPLWHRMAWIMVCAFGMIASYAAGLFSQFIALGPVPAVTITTILVTMVVRFYGVSPPGSLLFVTAASLGAYVPLAAAQEPTMLGLFAIGTLLACLIAFIYSALILSRRDPMPITPPSGHGFDYVVLDSVVIGAAVGISLLLAELLHMDKPYWAPVSCVAIMQGTTLHAVWSRPVERILGTGVGVLVAAALLQLPFQSWTIAITVIALFFMFQVLVVRHYALSSVFFTPMAILMAEAPLVLANKISGELIATRFWDTVLGCLIGVIGGTCLHNVRFRRAASRALRRVIPSRLLHWRVG